MALSSKRNNVNTALGIVLLAGVAYWLWPFVAGPRQMRSFCQSLPAGATVAQVRSISEQLGYAVSPVADGQSFIYSARAFGRVGCTVQFASSGLVSWKYRLDE